MRFSVDEMNVIAIYDKGLGISQKYFKTWSLAESLKISQWVLIGYACYCPTAVEFHHYDENHKPHWLFKCECGNEKVLPVNSVKWRSAVSQMRNRIVRKKLQFTFLLYSLFRCIINIGIANNIMFGITNKRSDKNTTNREADLAWII
ncbi:MAG: hypothetical protein IJ002_05145 [Clostridia bacterium]|nr:hypothetical protein [Clostridia bacterium]